MTKIIQDVEVFKATLQKKANLDIIDRVNERLNEIPTKAETKELRGDLFETTASLKVQVKEF